MSLLNYLDSFLKFFLRSTLYERLAVRQLWNKTFNKEKIYEYRYFEEVVEP